MYVFISVLFSLYHYSYGCSYVCVYVCSFYSWLVSAGFLTYVPLGLPGFPFSCSFVPLGLGVYLRFSGFGGLLGVCLLLCLGGHSLLQFDFPGCAAGEPDGDRCPQPYATPSNLQTRDEVATDLKEHVFRAHELPLQVSEAAVNKLKAETQKI